jgi:hypothetical protein
MSSVILPFQSAAARHLAPFFILAQFEKLPPAQEFLTTVRTMLMLTSPVRAFPVKAGMLRPVTLVSIIPGHLPQELPGAPE